MVRIADVGLEGGPRVGGVCPPELAIHPGDACIVEYAGALEYGTILTIEERDAVPEQARRGKVLRRATLQDQAREGENVVLSKMARDTCKARVAKRNLAIRVVRVRYSFDRAVLNVLFSSEDMLDVRDLAHELATELRARVDLKQIGVRDEAAIVGGLGVCGRKLCCCTWIDDFSSINVKMAKAQKLSLNPAAISGSCGRLKCCLRFEYEQYRELSRGLPRPGSDVECPGGRGCVLSCHPLRQCVTVRLDARHGVAEYPASDVRVVGGRTGQTRNTDDEDSGSERSESGPAWEA